MRRLLLHPAAHLLAIAAVALAAYAPAFGRGFVSEDFLLLRRLETVPFWPLLRDQFTGAWMGVAMVSFYRPVATLLLQLEHLVFGVQPVGYLVVHFLLHLLNVALVYRLAAGLATPASSSAAGAGRDRAVGFAAALVFALYPLHPNAVSFVAAYATLVATTFVLAATLAWRAGATLAALLLFVLALGSYEQALVLPPLLLVLDVLFPAAAGASRRWRRHLLPWLVAFLYLLLRREVLGDTLGGYGDFRERLLGDRGLLFVRDFLTGLAHFLWPDFDHAAPGWLVLALGALLAGGLVAAVRHWRRGGEAGRFCLAGLAWTVACQAPFSFATVVPANGRYWYLTSLGLVFLVVAAGLALAPRDVVGRSIAVVAAAAIVASGHLMLLRGHVAVSLGAAELARAVRDGVAEVAPPSERPVFLGGFPEFVHTATGSPAAAVFHWGLTDALRPPFVERPWAAYPLPPLPHDGFRPLLERPELRAATWWWWDTDWLPVPPPEGDPPPRLAVEVAPGSLAFRFQSFPDARHRLVLLTPANAAVLGLRPDLPAELPRAPLEMAADLYGGPVFWWVEAREGRGRLVAQSQLHVLDSEALPAVR